MQIGLIGGIGPAATDYYYRRLITAFETREDDLDLTIAHADTPTLIDNLLRNDTAAQVVIYNRLVQRLIRGGARCVAVSSIAGHFCIDAFKAISPLQVVDMVTAVNEAITARGLKRVGILGTRVVMESRVYGGIETADVIPPAGDELEAVNKAYLEMAASGVVTNDQRAVFDTAATRLIESSDVDAIMMGGTDLALVYREGETDFPIVDCAAVHVDALVRFATG